MLKESIRQVVLSQFQELKKDSAGIQRELLKTVDSEPKHAIILSGIRRCGKSTLLKQLLKKLPTFYYFNFEDPRAINFKLGDFETLEEVFKEEFGGSGHYFFDEIQNIKEWERFVRTRLDASKKFIITGSNASLLSKELGTRLTGRHLTYELFPFSYKEMLELKNQEPSVKTFEEYSRKGGFPEFLTFDKNEILHELFNDILLRDIVARYSLRESKTIKELAIYLLTNVGSEFSYNKLAKYFNVGSVNSVINYISYLEDSYLIFTIPKFEYSYKKQIINPKKAYSIDTGLSNANSASFSEDKGRVLENVVFLHLRRKYKEIYYFKKKHECDFVVKDKGKTILAVQVCYVLTEDNQEREVNGLKEAMKELKIETGVILTLNQDDKLNGIPVKSTWKWMEE